MRISPTGIIRVKSLYSTQYFLLSPYLDDMTCALFDMRFGHSVGGVTLFQYEYYDEDEEDEDDEDLEPEYYIESDSIVSMVGKGDCICNTCRISADGHIILMEELPKLGSHNYEGVVEKD